MQVQYRVQFEELITSLPAASWAIACREHNSKIPNPTRILFGKFEKLVLYDMLKVHEKIKPNFKIVSPRIKS